MNGIENNLVEYVEDFQVKVNTDSPVNEPGMVENGAMDGQGRK